MIEITIHGRGGQGGVTLAKLIATMYFLRGKDAQAFGLYAAERSGAPLQAFVRVDDEEITNHNQVVDPDHVVVLDRTLIQPGVSSGLKPDGWVILNTDETPESFATMFAGRKVATVNATRIATEQRLGTRVVPIVNTTLLGAVARVFDLPFAAAEAALTELKFSGANLVAARDAYESVIRRELSGTPTSRSPESKARAVAGILDDDIGRPPLLHTGTWATRRPHRHTLTPACNHGCRAGNDVRAFVAEMARESYDDALEILLQSSPLPGVCGRVCPAPCMDACNRRLFDEAVNIPELERAASDYGQRPAPTKPWRDEYVAVVGSGPAGLSAAYHLARLGYRITIYEASDELGGVMRTGIPTYRLPREILDNEIRFILDHGVEAQTGRCLDRAALMDLTHLHSAVVMGTGLQRPHSVHLGSYGRERIEDGLEFLDRARREEASASGQHVVVIGGGNTAIDAARTALRLGAERVTIVYRRTKEQMPAIEEEIQEALEEGVRIHELLAPLHLHVDSAGAGLICRRMNLGAPDASGRPRPIPETSEDSDIELRCDKVLLALGQDADQSILPEGAEVREGERLIGLTGAPIFFCGDFATGEGTVSATIGSGRAAAWHVHRTLSGEDLFPAAEPRVATYEDLHTYVFASSPRRRGGFLPSRFRRRSFQEVRRGLAIDRGRSLATSDAVAEAGRCFSCGVCNECDCCADYCPEGILMRDEEGYHFDYDYCKGCAICATVCPRGVIYMSEL